MKCTNCNKTDFLMSNKYDTKCIDCLKKIHTECNCGCSSLSCKSSQERKKIKHVCGCNDKIQFHCHPDCQCAFLYMPKKISDYPEFMKSLNF